MPLTRKSGQPRSSFHIFPSFQSPSHEQALHPFDYLSGTIGTGEALQAGVDKVGAMSATAKFGRLWPYDLTDLILLRGMSADSRAYPVMQTASPRTLEASASGPLTRSWRRKPHIVGTVVYPRRHKWGHPSNFRVERTTHGIVFGEIHVDIIS